MNSLWRIVLLSLLCSIPALDLGWRFYHFDLGANPVETLQHTTGNWALYFLLITLSITPINNLLRPRWSKFLAMHLTRRIFGLSAFCYAVLHLLSYWFFDLELSLPLLVEDVLERPFILMGMLALTLLVPLAITSTAGWQRRLKQRWQSLHKLVYPITLLAITHYVMLVKADLFQPLLMLLIFIVLMLLRNKTLLKNLT